MSNIASLLKTEIARVARKESRRETEHLRKASASYRSEIAALKKRVTELESKLRQAAKRGRGAETERPPGAGESQLRFSAKGLATHRKRLGLSARECGLLLSASPLAVYKWERGEIRPRAKYLPAIAALRSMGRRAARARLEELS